MVFFDKKERDLEEEVYTIKKIKLVSSRGDFELIKELTGTQKEAFYKTSVKNIDIDDALFTANYEYITFRVK